MHALFLRCKSCDASNAAAAWLPEAWLGHLGSRRRHGHGVNATIELCHAFEHALEHALEHPPQATDSSCCLKGACTTRWAYNSQHGGTLQQGCGGTLDAHGRMQCFDVALGSTLRSSHAFLYAMVAQRSMETQRWSAWGLSKAHAMITGCKVAEVACHRL